MKTVLVKLENHIGLEEAYVIKDEENNRLHISFVHVRETITLDLKNDLEVQIDDLRKNDRYSIELSRLWDLQKVLRVIIREVDL